MRKCARPFRGFFFGAPAVLLLAAALLLAPAPASAAPAPPQLENRFLFIIDTASAMRRSSNGVQEAVLGLLQSGMQGQLQDGDTIGFWTYDDQLHAGFPMQVWSGQKKDELLAKVDSFLRDLRFQKRAHLERIAPALREVVSRSQVITLIYIFDGTDAVQGTPFDKDINDLQKEFGRHMRSDHIPFVTVLAARNGVYFEYTVNVPRSVTLPRTAGFIARRPATNAAPVVVAAPAPKPPPPRHIELILTNPAPAVVVPPAPAPAPVVVAQAPVVQINPAPPPVQTPAAPAPVAVEPPTVAPASASVPATAPPANPSPASLQVAVAASGPPPVVANAGPAKSEPPASMPPSAAPSAPAVAVATHSPAVSSPVVSVPAASANPPAIAEARPAPVVAQTVVAVPSPEDHFALLVIAVSLLTIAVVLVLFLVRRSRSSPSLISQSMDRPR